MSSNLADARQALAAIAARLRAAKTTAERLRVIHCDKLYVEAVAHDLDHTSEFMYKAYHAILPRGRFEHALRRDEKALAARTE